MSIEMAIWRMTAAGPVSLTFSSLGKEEQLEDMVVADPSLTGLDVLVLGRQVLTDYGGIIDVLAIDSDAQLHVIELKRNKTPREVIAQTLDYASWVQTLTLDGASAIYSSQHDGELADAFAERFHAPIPDVFNPDQRMTVVASELDAASDRIVSFLAERYAVPINAVFFRYFIDGDVEYLARTWLISRSDSEGRSSRKSPGGKVRPWNGRDFYAVLGNTAQGTHRWDAARQFGFVGAGGGSWYWKPLRNLEVGNRVFAYVGGAGYVGVGEVTGPMTRLAEFHVSRDGTDVLVVEQPELAQVLKDRAESDDEEVTEFAVPVRWIAARPVSEAFMTDGLFSSQVTVCKLRDERTIDEVTAALGIPAD